MQPLQPAPLVQQNDQLERRDVQLGGVVEQEEATEESTQATTADLEAELQQAEDENTESSIVQQHPQVGYIRPNVTYGHIHMAKTAGTTLNGAIAMRYERVCGHKGYSYDAIQQNRRVKKLEQSGKNNNQTEAMALVMHTQDSYAKVKKGGYNRGRVPPEVMWEIGWEDCDWISLEQGQLKWTNVQRSVRQTLEFHIPCRDPIDHLLSQCNYANIGFQCDIKPDNPQRLRITGLKKFRGGKAQLHTPLDHIKHCIRNGFRFPSKYGNNKKFTRKCFDFRATEQYMKFMDGKLQPKRMVEPYINRETNQARKKEKECLTDPEYAELRQQVRDHLLEKDPYYKFCDSCMGSSDELFTYVPKAKPQQHQLQPAAGAEVAQS